MAACMSISEIQRALREERLDGWLFFDHHQRDPLAYRVLQFQPARVPTRRWYYFIPAEGEPKKLVHRIEAFVLDPLPGGKDAYSSWNHQLEGVRTLVAGSRRIAMQYSPECAVPYVSMVDAGTIELVRSTGVEIVSSANLIQLFEARWDQRKLDSHLEAGALVDNVRRLAFERIGDSLRAGERITEWDIKQFILRRFSESNLTTDHGPIVAVNANASNPHYEPELAASSEIRAGGLVLIDLWAKISFPGAVYYDITWTGYCGQTPPEEMRNIFETVRGARDAAVKFVSGAVAAGRSIRGFEVDDVARSHIRGLGLAQYFFHRTGHSIGEDVHGAGANMDNLETHDERRIIPWSCFSIEPGVYLPEFGIRSEVNMFVGEREARVTGEVQQSLVAVL
jgi:Xaa-Pro aminopeptidase